MTNDEFWDFLVGKENRERYRELCETCNSCKRNHLIPLIRRPFCRICKTSREMFEMIVTHMEEETDNEKDNG